MDKEQQAEEVQFLGFFGIFKESFKIIWSWRKFVSQITLALILPLSFIFLANKQISQLLYDKILNNEDTLLDQTQKNSTYPSKYAKFSDMNSSEWTAFWVFKAAYFTLLLILSLLSTSAVVYTIACIYTAKEITFKKVMSVLPKVWKRLLVTFIFGFVVLLVYNVVAVVLCSFLFTVAFIGFSIIGFSAIGYVVGVVLLSLHLTGFVYLKVVWELASVVSVLEDVSGIQALRKSKTLIKGKMGIAVAIFLLLSICSIVIGNFEVVYEKLVVLGLVPSIDIRIGVGIIIWFVFLFKEIISVFGLVVQTVFYFVCKSYHNENIDKSSLADHLEVYTWDYVRLESKEDVQLGEFHV